ncbi:MAG: TIGR01777 family oxidoreductase [Bacteroidetes bacterium]|nr:TIGR01777 family oxidoreductase [Bacteroidota bacterium]
MRILISGGSGLLGREITKQLLSKKHEVAWLSRNPNKCPKGVLGFSWDPDQMQIDKAAIDFADAIINLAGANIAKSWTPHYKNEILRSRVDGTRLLFNTVRERGKALNSFVSASAVGYYPNSEEKTFSEEDAPGNDFLSLICQKWEQEAQSFESLNIRTIRLRIGIVLDPKEGALAQMAAPLKFGLGAPLGNGGQWMPWIHRVDVAALFVSAVENSDFATGVYNAVGPENHRNKELTKILAKTLKRPLLLPPVPKFVLKIMLGEMSAIALASTKTSNEKVLRTGFQYQFKSLESALKDLYLA